MHRFIFGRYCDIRKILFIININKYSNKLHSCVGYIIYAEHSLYHTYVRDTSSLNHVHAFNCNNISPFSNKNGNCDDDVHKNINKHAQHHILTK